MVHDSHRPTQSFLSLSFLCLFFFRLCPNSKLIFLQMTLQVSWVRHRDVHLLTIGRYTYTNDQRFRAIHTAHSDDWTLQIKYPQHRDSGIYECQVSTTPHMSHLVHLNVIGKSLLHAPQYLSSGK